MAERVILGYARHGVDRSNPATVAAFERLFGEGFDPKKIRLGQDGRLELTVLSWERERVARRAGREKGVRRSRQAFHTHSKRKFPKWTDLFVLPPFSCPLGKLAVPPLLPCKTYIAHMSDPARSLYLVCYDIADPRRLHRVHKFLMGYKAGGQKSFFECWLTAGELAQVRLGLLERMSVDEDRAHIFQLDPRQQIQRFGVAAPVPKFFAIL
ncbi:MAG: CRISPR-associated endonuclease Cas2 [Candidatus Accumulibacter sp.]|nr:CRISPR-associated endonuclease Cas2 [Accumulibacter sp.]